MSLIWWCSTLPDEPETPPPSFLYFIKYRRKILGEKSITLDNPRIYGITYTILFLIVSKSWYHMVNFFLDGSTTPWLLSCTNQYLIMTDCHTQCSTCWVSITICILVIYHVHSFQFSYYLLGSLLLPYYRCLN